MPVFHFAVAANGSLAYVRGVNTGSIRRTLALVDATGRVDALPVPANGYRHPRVLPDGTQFVVATDDGREAAVWVGSLTARAAPRRLPFEGRNLEPIWTPDGRSVTFQSDREGDRGLFVQQPTDRRQPGA